MREEEEPSWFARWEEQLPAPEELMPLSQSLITHDLAVAFDIPSHGGGEGGGGGGGAGGAGGVDGVAGASAREMNGGASSAAGSSGGGGGGGGEEPARTLKRPRLVWTPQLHKRFVDAVAHLGIKNAVPKTIMQLMSVDGLTRENVASHLQKYRLYLKRMQGFGNGAGGAGAGAGGGAGGSHSSGSGTDAATEHLFATGPVPFLPPGRAPAGAGVDPYPPFAPMAAHHHHHPPQIGHFHHPAGRPLGHFGAGPGAGFDHGFLNRAVAVGAPPVGPPGMHRMVGGAAGMGMIAPSSFADDLELGSRGGGSGGGRRELTLFPTSGDH